MVLENTQKKDVFMINVIKSQWIEVLIRNDNIILSLKSIYKIA